MSEPAVVHQPAQPEPPTVIIGPPPERRSADVLEITDANFQEEVAESDVPVLLHFGADWSGPSRLLTPIMDELADTYAGRVKVGSVNVDDYQALAEQFGVSQIPTVILIKDGSEQGRISGGTSEEAIVELLEQYLGTQP